MLASKSGSQFPGNRDYSSTEATDLLELQDRILGSHFEKAPADKGDFSAEYVDLVLAREFNQLSTQERSRTYEELHGVDECVVETPLFIDNSLRRLDEELANIRRKPAYELAKQQNKAYVTNPQFRLMFLRADGFHPEKAATRLVGYFEGKLEYFGESRLTKQIQFSDLDHNDQACVKSGHMQVLPSRDQSGRAIFTDVDVFHDQSYTATGNRLKAYIYFWLLLAEDEENQKRGVVVIVTQLGPLDLGKANPTLAREHPRLLRWIPIRVCALHCCSDNNVTGFLFRAAVVGGPADMRVRHRYHTGTYTEIMYSLLGYGIPVDVFPSNDGIAIKRTNLNRWIAKYVARDKEQAKNGGRFSGIDLPTRNDVLTGKGKPIQHHPGNVQLRTLVNSHMEEYKANKLQSKMAVNKVISIIRARQGRFLSKDNEGWWRELSDLDAIDKVTKTFLTVRTNQNNEIRAARTKDSISSETMIFLQRGKRQRYDDSCCYDSSR